MNIIMLSEKEYLKRFSVIQEPTVNAVRRVAKRIQPGQTEIEIAEILDKELRGDSLSEHWYPILVHAGEMTGVPVSRRYHLPANDVVVHESDILILDVTPIDKTVWSNWAETFAIGNDEFYNKLTQDVQAVVDAAYEYSSTQAKTVGDIVGFCSKEIEKYNLRSIDSRKDFGHSIFQVPEGQTVDKTPLGDRLFLNEDYRNVKLSGIISIEPHLARLNSVDGKLYGAKQQRVLIF